MDLQILTKTEKNIKEDIKVLKTSDVVEIKEVNEIRSAVKEHLLFIGLDRGNNVRNISVLGIGSNCEIMIDSKDIIRIALFSCSDRVILVHNHPSNSLEPSSKDLHLTNITNQILKVFNIELLDHIIVTEKDYMSLEGEKRINKKYRSNDLDNMDKGLLIEKNLQLKNKIKELEKQIDNINFESNNEIEKEYGKEEIEI